MQNRSKLNLRVLLGDGQASLRGVKREEEVPAFPSTSPFQVRAACPFERPGQNLRASRLLFPLFIFFLIAYMRLLLSPCQLLPLSPSPFSLSPFFSCPHYPYLSHRDEAL